MITADYHVHCNFSPDAPREATMESMIEKAISLGFTRICMTDHLDYNHTDEEGLNFELDVPAYYNKLLAMQDKYSSKIKVLKGVELGLEKGVAPKCKELLSHYDFDYVIGSTHFVNGVDPYLGCYWEGISEKEGIEKYLCTITENLHEFDGFNAYGHLDYAVRYAPNKNKYYNVAAYQHIIDEILKSLIEAGKGIEVNTAGYKYGLGYAHPQTDVIKRYFELGGEILTIGSDGHKPEHLAFDFSRARDMLTSIGVKYYTVFEQQKPIFLPL